MLRFAYFHAFVWLCLLALVSVSGQASDYSVEERIARIQEELARSQEQLIGPAHIFDFDREFKFDLPDQQEYQQGYFIKLMGLNAALKFHSLEITPVLEMGSIKLHFKVGVKDLHVNIPHIYLYKRRPINCYYSNIFFGHHYPTFYEGTYQVSFEGFTLALELLKSELSISPNDYSTCGPSVCRGRFFNRPLVRRVVSGKVASSRAMIEDKVEETITDFIPEMELDLLEIIEELFK